MLLLAAIGLLGVFSVWRLYLGIAELTELTRRRRAPYYPPLAEEEERPVGMTAQETDQWMVDFFQDFPESRLREKYPEQYGVAMAVLRYRALEVQRQGGMITEEEYAAALDAIAALVPLGKIC